MSRMPVKRKAKILNYTTHEFIQCLNQRGYQVNLHLKKELEDIVTGEKIDKIHTVEFWRENEQVIQH